MKMKIIPKRESENRSRTERSDASDTANMLEQGFLKVPSFVFRDRSVAVLECLVEYMKDVKGLTFHEIAMMLNRNDRTIWTVYRRAKLKRSGLTRKSRSKSRSADRKSVVKDGKN